MWWIKKFIDVHTRGSAASSTWTDVIATVSIGVQSLLQGSRREWRHVMSHARTHKHTSERQPIATFRELFMRTCEGRDQLDTLHHAQSKQPNMWRKESGNSFIPFKRTQIRAQLSQLTVIYRSAWRHIQV